MLRKYALCGAVGIAFASSAHASALLTEPFTYADGPLDGAAGSPWLYYSGTGSSNIKVSSGQAVLTSSGNWADAAALSGGSVTSGHLYAGFDINFTALPTASGSSNGGYFAGFKAGTTSGLSTRGKVWAQVATDNPLGAFQIGVTDNSTTASAVVLIPIDLSLNTTYRIVEDLNVGTGRTTIFLNPTVDSQATATQITATDSTSSSAMAAYLLRDAAVYGGGSQFDNLTVATTFNEAVPEPTSLSLIGIGGLAALRRRRA